MSEMVQIASTLLIIDKVFLSFKFLVFLESGKVVIEVLFFFLKIFAIKLARRITDE